MKLGFRYSADKYNRSLLNLGNIRIGTLHNFRKAEHKKGIADGKEGKKSVSHFIESDIVRGDGSRRSPAVEAFQIAEAKRGAVGELEGVTVRKSFDVSDRFVHCISAGYSLDVLREFDGANSCVEISDIKRFYERLTESLNYVTPVQLEYLGPVLYADREEIWNGRDWGVNPAVIKEKHFSPQLEVRAIWRPKLRVPIEPIFLYDVGLVKFCRLLPCPRDN
ncbi:hypothetical protein KC131_24450 [Pseudomonas sp. JQ170]|uniref:hypothetical protein n=1 Tax=unclassified Pseudomonas TaxID=196821 RepID=UPI00264CD2CF|nr:MULTISPECIES: hypothetical protein [unclassified Pseudomonas]MDN7143802.1 hypothetical protein [Pseudomonas sp. JQ170]WRO77720.1 hypothetical protein U9R80_08600 [Pseudomonas sp. 170C]